MKMRRDDKVYTSEWSPGSVGLVIDINANGAKIEVREAMGPDFFVTHVIRTEWWPRSDWTALQQLPTETEVPQPKLQAKGQTK